MARTVITPQTPSAKSGQTITFATIDVANGMQVALTSRTIVLVVTASASGVTVAVVAVNCSHARTETISTAIGASLTKAFGPFNPAIFGDGNGQLLLDFSGQSGTTTIAVIEPL